MFTTTMNDAEIQREARKDFFELSTKVRIATERFNRCLLYTSPSPRDRG